MAFHGRVQTRLLAQAVTCLLLAEPVAAQVTVTIRDLGTLGGPYSNSYALNDRGQVAGISHDGTDGRLFRWERGVMTLVGPREYGYSGPAMNQDGQVSGTQMTRSGMIHAYFWKNGSIRDVGTLGGRFSAHSALPGGINSWGEMVGRSTNSQGEQHAFLWADGAMTDLGTLGGTRSWARVINDRSQVAGESTTATGGIEAFIWENGVMTDIGSLAVRAINDHGQVVGTTPGRHAVLSDGVVLTDLGTLGGTDSYATGINASGVVIGYSMTDRGEVHAFRWEAGQMIDLGTVGGMSSWAWGINDRGEIVGEAVTANGERHAFYWFDRLMIDLGTLGGRDAIAYAINNYRQIAGDSQTAAGPTHATLWEVR